MNLSELGRVIQKERSRCHLKQSDVADALRISPPIPHVRIRAGASGNRRSYRDNVGQTCGSLTPSWRKECRQCSATLSSR